MLSNEQIIEQKFPAHTCLAAYRGSVAHNLFIPSDEPDSSDDIDLTGIYFLPAHKYLDVSMGKQTYESFVDEYDVVSYEFKKAISLLTNANPNMISMLFLKKSHYLYKDFYGRGLIDHRRLFLSKKLYNSFIGYAHGCLEKVQKDTFQGYMGSKRKVLVEKVGYDPKNAAHCIRLLRMGIEFMETAKINVYRTKDKDDLLSIKRGEWSLEYVKDEAAYLFSKAKHLLETWDYPEEPDYKNIKALAEDMLYDYIVSNYKKH